MVGKQLIELFQAPCEMCPVPGNLLGFATEYTYDHDCSDRLSWCSSDFVHQSPNKN